MNKIISKLLGRVNKPVVPIFYTIDDEYASAAYASIFSLIKNANPACAYNIHIIYQKLNAENLARFAELSCPGFNIILNELKEELDFIADTSGNRLNGSIFTLAIYFRLFIPDAFPEYDKGIYLDADTIVPGDISELFATDLGRNLLGGAKDLSIAGVPEFIEYIEQGDGVPFDSYINSGVLLMNMRALREAGLRARFLEIFNQYHAATVAPDQDYLNTLCYGRIAYLDRAWNTMPAPGLTPLDSPKLIHYNLFLKPWRTHVDYDNYFWEYAFAAGLEPEFRELLNSRTEQDAAADAAALQEMLGSAREITARGTGLARVFQQEPRLGAASPEVKA